MLRILGVFTLIFSLCACSNNQYQNIDISDPGHEILLRNDGIAIPTLSLKIFLKEGNMTGYEQVCVEERTTCSQLWKANVEYWARQVRQGRFNLDSVFQLRKEQKKAFPEI